jgi:UDP-N-acetylmuramoylalanine--D-glutamate ligase
MGEEFTARVGRRSLTVDVSQLKIKGLHNAYNAMAASLAALAAGVERQSILSSLYEFSPVEHRLEPAGERDGVQWINDSKATNVDSVWYALQSMTRPTVWIAGGTDKGNDYTPLKEFASEKVKALVCMGLDNTKLQREFEGIVPTIESYDTMEAAMRAAARLAEAGDAVLLSPACASFDLFKNYEQRGELFKQWVKENILK